MKKRAMDAHAAMVIVTCRAGKDVHVEKPLTLTVVDGRRICEIVRETGHIVQVGSWRSDHHFRLTVEMVRQGRIGRLKRVNVWPGVPIVTTSRSSRASRS